MCSGIPIKLLNFSDLTKFLVLNFHAKHHIFNGLNTWLLGAVNKFSKNNRSIAKWLPAENQGQKVASYFNIPISFKLTPSEPKDSTATTKP